MGSPHEDLHHLIDRLPGIVAGELLNFGLYLEQREQARPGAKVRAILNAAPLDDEPYTDEERAEVEGRLAGYRREDGVSLESLMKDEAGA